MRAYKIISRYRNPKSRLPESVYFPWNFSLLSPAQRAEWEAYKKTPEYLGFDESEKVRRSRVPEGLKLQEWVNSKQLGVARPSTKPTGDNRLREQVLNYVFELKPDVEYFFDAKQVDGEEENENAKRATQSVFRQLEKREIFDEKSSVKSVEGFIEITAVHEDVTPAGLEAGSTGEKVVEKTDYSKMTFNDLQVAVKTRGLRGKFGATKVDLIEMLEHDDAAKIG